MKPSHYLTRGALPALLLPCALATADSVQVYQTSRAGDRLAEKTPLLATPGEVDHIVVLRPDERHQTITGFGGSFTEAGAQVLSELSAPKRREVIEAYFSPEGAGFSLTRTHIASCDFSVRNYTYAPVPGDTKLEHFSIEPDRTYLLPMIREAMEVEGADFRIIASPWTAPPWMKTNRTWNGGRLMEEHYGTFADYIVRYLATYAAEGIPIWGITPINEPLGNGSNWESTHFTPAEMAEFVGGHLGPAVEGAGLDTKIWVYDQNREEEMLDWARTLFNDEQAARHIDGMAVHWYQSTDSIGAEILDTVAREFPEQPLLHSEGCIDAMGDDEPVGAWLEDDWYWRPEATDWGFFWAAEENRDHHPRYRPFRRYARDLILGLNHHLTGWVDWNMVLNTRGGPNHARNYCLAPVLVDSGRAKVYYTPLYYAIAHVSKFIRPGAQRIGIEGSGENFFATACRNPDGSLAVVMYNPAEKPVYVQIRGHGGEVPLLIDAQAMQTVRLAN